MPTPSDGPVLLPDLGPLAGRDFAAVLFDLDGTLIDSTPVVERSWRRWGVEFGVPMDSYGSWHGVPSAAIVAEFLPVARRAEGSRRIEQIEVADTDGVVALPGAAEALTSVGGRSAIATSCSRDLAAVRIAASGLQPPDVVVTASDTPVGKPDPAPWLLAARRLGVDPADCLVVEDAPAGLVAARAAAAATLAVRTTHPDGGLDADALVPDLAAVRFAVAGGRVRVSPAPAGATPVPLRP